MLDKIRRGQRWLTALLVSAIGLVFIVFFGPWAGQQAPTSVADAVVEVDDILIDGNDFYRRREQQTRQLREQLGDDFDEKAARAFLDQQVLRSLIEQGVLAYSAREIGIQVTRAEIQRFLRDSYTDSAGNFDQDLIVDLIEREYGTQRIFLETIEREFLATKLIQLLHSQVHVSDDELRQRVRSMREDVQLAYVRLDLTMTPADVVLDDPLIEAFRSENEAALRTRYEERIEVYSTPDRVKARHLLVEVPEGADEAAETSARDEAEEARKRIVGGADFADLARELSDDLGTRDSGGELGLVSRTEIAASIADAAFDLDVGAVSEVVRSTRGFHLVLIEETIPGGTRSFDDAALELAREGALLELAREAAHEHAEALATAIRAGESLEDAARLRDLTLVRTGGLRRRPDGFVPDLGPAPELLALAFALEPGESSPRIFELGNRLILIQSIARNTPSDLDVEAQIAGMREGILSQKRNSAVRSWVDTEQRRLDAAGKLRINSALVIGS